MHLSDIAAAVRATTAHIRAELAALGEEGASYHPAEGEWCAKEVVGHLVEADLRGFAGRVRQILAGQEIQAWDQPQVAALRGDCGRPWTEVLAEFTETRADSLEIFDEVGDGDLDRAATHPLVGELSIRDILHEWPFHDRDHLKQILENTRQWYWPELGAAQQFTLLEG